MRKSVQIKKIKKVEIGRRASRCSVYYHLKLTEFPELFECSKLLSCPHPGSKKFCLKICFRLFQNLLCYTVTHVFNQAFSKMCRLFDIFTNWTSQILLSKACNEAMLFPHILRIFIKKLILCSYNYNEYWIWFISMFPSEFSDNAKVYYTPENRSVFSMPFISDESDHYLDTRNN